MRMGYSYTRGLIPPEDKTRHTLLNQFWTETDEAMGKTGLTIRGFKMHSLRLAFLAAQDKYALYAELLPYFRRLKTGTTWQNLSNYTQQHAPGDLDPLAVGPYPFCFETVLCHLKGEIGLTAFLDAYLDSEFPLGLSAFPKEGKGPHTDYVADPASFLTHDFQHWGGFWGRFKDQPELWDRYQEIARRIMRTEVKPSCYLQVTLFLLSHEVGFEVLADKKMTFNYFFKEWINSAITDIKKSVETEKVVIEAALTNIELPMQGLHAEVESVVGLDDNLNQCNAILGFYYNKEPLCAVQTVVDFSPSTLSLNGEIVRFTKLSFKNWDMDIIKGMNGRWCWCRTTVQSLKTRIATALEGKSFPVQISRSNQYKVSVVDHIFHYNLAMGSKVLKRTSPKVDVVKAFTQFWIDFYKRYAPLFQDEGKSKFEISSSYDLVQSALYKANPSLPQTLFMEYFGTREGKVTIDLFTSHPTKTKGTGNLTPMGQVFASVDISRSPFEHYNHVDFSSLVFMFEDEDAPKRVSTCCKRVSMGDLRIQFVNALTRKSFLFYSSPDSSSPLDDLDLAPSSLTTEVEAKAKGVADGDEKDEKEGEKRETRVELPLALAPPSPVVLVVPATAPSPPSPAVLVAPAAAPSAVVISIRD